MYRTSLYYPEIIKRRRVEEKDVEKEKVRKRRKIRKIRRKVRR